MPSSWRIPDAIFDAMVAQGERDFPEETGGFVFGRPDGSDLELAPMENIQNRLHAEDPKAYPRDARTAYQFDSLAFDRLQKDRDAAGLEVRGVYHTHPDHDAYFSEKDRADAAPEGWGPLFPGAVYIVLSIREGRLADAKGFTWSDETEDFVEIAVERGGDD